MGEEADTSDYDGLSAGEDDDVRVLEWEIGLPSAEDLTPLLQPLIPSELASAFSITPEPSRTLLDVHRASQKTVSSLRRQVPSSSSSASAPRPFPSFAAASADDATVVDGGESTVKDGTAHSSSTRKMRRSEVAMMEEADSNDDPSARMLKRPRLVWTSQLHKRFMDVVALLGIKKAVPKTIMQLMNVEGLTRENVASHLQKYRLYLRRMHGLSDEGRSSSGHLFDSTPVPHGLHEMSVPVPMPYAPPPPPALIPMPVLGIAHHGHGTPVSMVPVNGQHGVGAYHGFESHQPYGVFGERQEVLSGGNKFVPMVSYPHVSSNGK